MWIFSLYREVIADQPYIYSDYLTNWGDTIILIYLIFTLGVIFHEFLRKKDENQNEISKQDETDNLMTYYEEPAPWYYYVCQLLYEIAFSAALFITSQYYAGLKFNDN